MNYINKVKAFIKKKTGITDLQKKTSFLCEVTGIRNIDFFNEVLQEKINIRDDFVRFSKGQLNQDLFVLFYLDFKKNGYFVEFGATDGLSLSNTHLLEKKFSWKGIVAEPAKIWHKKLSKARSCHVDKRCVWKESGVTLDFLETAESELSTIAQFSYTDNHKKKREDNISYSVDTVSLYDLLKYHKAPKKIDYLSIDTEGSEYDILNAFDFSEYDIRIITVEHNYTNNREKIYDLLTKRGFKRVFEQYSGFDDWYVKDV